MRSMPAASSSSTRAVTSAAAPDRFGQDLGMLVVDAGTDQGADDAAGRDARGDADRAVAASQPCGNDRAEPGDRQQTDTRQQPCAAADRAADARTLRGIGRDFETSSTSAVLGADMLAGDDADVVGPDACLFRGRPRRREPRRSSRRRG